MRTIITALAAALSLALVTGCSTATPEQRAANQESADQKFGNVKLALVAASGVVGIYNLLCNDTLATSAICAKTVSDAVNDGLAGASDAVTAAEKVFAAANTDQDARLKAANIAGVAVAALTDALKKYGVNRLKSGR